MVGKLCDHDNGYKHSAHGRSAYLFFMEMQEEGVCDYEKKGNRLYEAMSGKMSDGCVYPKGIRNLFSQEGFKVKYCAGNITALKNEVSQGNPVVVMIRTQTGQNGLHYVPVVGYDEQYIFMAESLGQFINCDSSYFNRKIAVREFKKLWNTSMLKMPLYRNTYIAVQYSK